MSVKDCGHRPPSAARVGCPCARCEPVRERQNERRRESRRKWLSDPVNRERQNERRRKWESDPANRERRRERRLDRRRDRRRDRQRELSEQDQARMAERLGDLSLEDYLSKQLEINTREGDDDHDDQEAA